MCQSLCPCLSVTAASSRALREGERREGGRGHSSLGQQSRTSSLVVNGRRFLPSLFSFCCRNDLCESLDDLLPLKLQQWSTDVLQNERERERGQSTVCIYPMPYCQCLEREVCSIPSVHF